MGRTRRWSVLLLCVLWLMGCATPTPPSRLTKYVGLIAATLNGLFYTNHGIAFKEEKPSIDFVTTAPFRHRPAIEQ